MHHGVVTARVTDDLQVVASARRDGEAVYLLRRRAAIAAKLAPARVGGAPITVFIRSAVSFNRLSSLELKNMRAAIFAVEQALRVDHDHFDRLHPTITRAIKPRTAGA
jgi:hypothetical protein